MVTSPHREGIAPRRPASHGPARVAAVLVLAAGALAAACTSGQPTAPRQEPRSVVVAEAFESAGYRADNIDSLAVWAPQGWLLATAKATDSVLVLRASDGSLVSRFSGSGRGPGQLKRPNGVAVVDDLLLVVERDNHRLQVLRLPALEPLDVVGEELLRFPYGIAVFRSAAGRYEALVTDSYQLPDGSVPPPEQLGERVKHFRLELAGNRLTASLVRAFGPTSGAGMLHIVESIAADPLYDRVLVADEAPGSHDIKVFDLSGRFTGQRLGQGLFQAEPEGIALLARGRGGYWVTTDQQKARTVFHLFDRETLALVGSFTGRMVANTDGIVVASEPVAGFPEGAVFAVHDDASVAAFAWPAVAEALGLAPVSSQAGEPRGQPR
ncbi:MAG: phytase [Thermoanaerobaculaceae bacterium]